MSCGKGPNADICHTAGPNTQPSEALYEFQHRARIRLLYIHFNNLVDLVLSKLRIKSI